MFGYITVNPEELSKQQLAQCIAACGFPANVRGETLSIPEFARLADAIGELL